MYLYFIYIFIFILLIYIYFYLHQKIKGQIGKQLERLIWGFVVNSSNQYKAEILIIAYASLKYVPMGFLCGRTSISEKAEVLIILSCKRVIMQAS